jgi:HK97 gp10 family phage protein
MSDMLHLKGFEELERGLNALPAAIASKIARQSMLKGARVIQREAKLRAPVRIEGGVRRFKKGGKGRLPGYLRASIVARLKRVPGAGITYAIGWTKLAFYGAFIEFGTRRQAARPFLRPAADSKFAEAVQTIGADLGPKIEREARKLFGGK